MQEALKKHAAEGVEKGDLKITLYKNGIVIGAPNYLTAAIPFDSPDGKAVMGAFEAGRLPPLKLLPAELQERAKKGDLHVEVDDLRASGEEFVAPKPGPFDRAGQALGGGGAPPTPGAVVQDSAGMAAPALPAGAAAASMQVRLANGQKLLVALAPEHTVRDLQRVVAGAHATGGKPFVLKAGFPPRVLEDPAATVEAAGLSGCAVTQMAV